MKKNTKLTVYVAIIFAFAIIAEQGDVILADKNDDSADFYIPNDPLFGQQWSANNPDGFHIGAPAAWAIERGNRKIAIAILDTGVDLTHPDLVKNLWTNPNEIPGNGKDDDNNGYVDDVHGINAITGSGDPSDDNGHGTHVAGIIGAEGNNGIGIAGVMHEVSLIPCKFLDAAGTGTIKNAIRCMNYIADLAQRDSSVTIVATNNAWGGGAYDAAMHEAILEHRDLGIIFVVDAGGGAVNIDDVEQFPATYEANNIIVVGKSDSHGALTDATNFGSNTVHIASPGLDLLSTTLNGDYKVQSGSSATGIVSGVIGLMSAHDPDLSWAQIKHRIMASAALIDDAADRSKLISGGIVHASRSLRGKPNN